MRKSALAAAIAAAAFAGALAPARPAHAYIEVAMTLGKIVNDSTTIVLMQVESVDKTKNTITYKKIEDIKGKHPLETIKHNIAQGGFSPREWQTIMAWAEPGKFAVFCHNNSASETCIENYWYQCYPGGNGANSEWWNMYHAEPYLLRTYAGKPEKLVPLVKQMLEGKEVAATAMVDGDKNALHNRTARVQRLKASLKIQDYDAKRDFLGWGGDELKLIASMPGFSHFAPFTKTSPNAAGALTFDFDGDAKPDFLLFGESRVGLYTTDGTSTNEIALPLTTGARGAAVASFRNDKLADIVLAAPGGVKLLSNAGSGTVRDDSAALPKLPYANPTAVATLDYDGDGKPDLLVADGFAGLRLYRNITAANAGKETVPQFVDVSDKAGLGSAGAAAGRKGPFGSQLLVADLNGDKRPDIVFLADAPTVLLNTPAGFAAQKDSGLAFTAVKGIAAIASVGGVPTLAVPMGNKIALFRSDSTGRFTETAPVATGSSPGAAGEAACAAFANLGGPTPDLLVGMVRGSNRAFRNKGGGFVDVSATLGLNQRVFNTRALAVVDVNRDNAADLLLNNEGQEPVLLIGKKDAK